MKTQDTNFNPKMSSEPLEEKPKCTLSDYDLIIMATGWVSKLCESGGTKFEMRIPVDYNHDTDMIFTEVIQRFEKANDRISSLESELKALREWKESEMLVWGPVLEYCQDSHNELGIPLGSSISKFILNMLKESKALREENERLVKERDEFAIKFLKSFDLYSIESDHWIRHKLEQFKAYTLNTEKN